MQLPPLLPSPSKTKHRSLFRFCFNRTNTPMCLFVPSSATVSALCAIIISTARAHFTCRAAAVAEATTFADCAVSDEDVAAAWEASMHQRQIVWDAEVLANTAKKRYLSAELNINASVGDIMNQRHDLDRSDAFVRVRGSPMLVSKRSRYHQHHHHHHDHTNHHISG